MMKVESDSLFFAVFNAKPKSMIFTLSSSSTRMFAGLMSR